MNYIENANLPEHTVFDDWKTAKRFAGPLPFTFTYNSKKKEILIIEGVRQNWIPKPIEVQNFSLDFFNDYNFTKFQLSNAFIIENIPYYWKKGRIEKWIKS